jgi:Uma2 family endonuclease
VPSAPCYTAAMNIALRTLPMTRAQFFDWASAREERYEFDGEQPVAMTGGPPRHNIILLNIHRSLFRRLKNAGCRPLGPDAGVATVDDAIRYPDALVTCSKFVDTEHLVPGAVVVFEVISPTSSRVDRIVKVREYHAVPSIRRYVIVEYASMGMTVFSRDGATSPWTANTLTAGDNLEMAEIGIEIPVSEFYEGTDVPAAPEEAADGVVETA